MPVSLLYLLQVTSLAIISGTIKGRIILNSKLMNNEYIGE